jgi:hypothetical protein
VLKGRTRARLRRTTAVVALLAAIAAVAACSAKAIGRGPVALPTADPTVTPTPGPTSAPQPPRPRSTKKPTPSATLKKPTGSGGDVAPTTRPTTSDGVPTKGNGTFSIAAGGTPVVGTGKTLVQYRVEVENGIVWGTTPAWTPASFASAVDTILAGPRSWIASGEHPVTDAAENMTNASWSFQRVSGGTYGVRIRLATPDTVDRICGAAGVQTQGQYSCRVGSTLMINLRRWLKGVSGFGTNLTGYRNMVINHEMGHFLGFNHMKCPGTGQPAPVMQTQTIALNGCTPNPYPFAADGTFVIGPWAPS